MKKYSRLLEEYLLPIVLFAIGFSYYLYLQFRYPLLYGVDGAFYAGETKCILLTGYPCLIDSPLPLYMPVLFVIAGLEIECSVKFSLALFTSMTVIPLYLLSRRIGGPVNAIIVSAIYLFNPFTMRLSVEFLKNIVALFFFAICFYYFYIVFVEKHHSRYKYIYPVVLLIALSHILVYGVLILLTIVALAYSILRDRSQAKRIVFILLFELFIAIVGVVTPILGWSPYFRAVSEGGRQLAVLETIDYTSPETLLSFTAIALSIYAVYTISGRRIITLPLLVAESVILTPLPMLAGVSWRLLLLFSIYLPLSTILYISKGNLTHIYPVISLGILLSSIIISINGTLGYYKPVIGSEVVDELEEVVPNYLGDYVVFIVPDKVLRHWVFFIAAPHKVFDDYDRALLYLYKNGLEPGDYVFIEILYSPNPMIKPPEPSIPHILLYHGRYIYVYEVKV